MKLKSYSVGVVVGRFQVSELHEAHKQIISMARLNHRKLLVFIACTMVKGCVKDPLDYKTRANMIKYEFPDAWIFKIDDNPSDEVWSRDLDGQIVKAVGTSSVLLYSGKGGFASHYKGRYRVNHIKEIDFYRGSELREIQGKMVPLTKEGRSGVIYGVANQWPRVYPTVDMAVLNDKGEVLLGIKRDMEGLRFPGGFVDPTDKDLEEAARREVYEECGGIETGDYTYICSGIVDDWRYRNRSAKIMSTLFSCKYVFGNYAEACNKIDSEFVKLRFYPSHQSTLHLMADTHVSFFKRLLKSRRNLK